MKCKIGFQYNLKGIYTMKIKDIKNAETHETRTDGRYPLRIGSTVEFHLDNLPILGEPMYLSYLMDKYGNEKDGVFRTSYVKNITEIDTTIIVETKHSIYYLEK